jgi:hypothetical protein
MVSELRATDLLQPLGRFSRTQFALVLLGAGSVTAVLLAAVAEIYLVWSFVLFWIVVVAVTRRLHDRDHSGFFFLLLLFPVANAAFLLYLLLAPSARVDPVGRGVSLEYYTSEVRIRVFQDREAARFDDVLLKYEKSLTSHPGLSEHLVEAGTRIRAATREVWKRRAEDLTPVPESALLLYLRWQECCEAREAWTEAKIAAVDDVAAGGTPASARLKILLGKSEKTRRAAEREERRFLETWRLHRDSVLKMVTGPLMDEGELDDWRPDKTDHTEV